MARPKKAGTTAVPAAPVPAPMRGALDIPALCAYLSCSRQTVYRLIRDGDLKPIYIRTRKPVFRVTDVDAFLANMAEAS